MVVISDLSNIVSERKSGSLTEQVEWPEHGLTIFEMDHFVGNWLNFLGNGDLKKYGSLAWVHVHAFLERLTRLAQQQAADGTDEWLKDWFVKKDGGIQKLIYELITVEFWREKILPAIESIDCCGLKVYLPTHHELLLANILEFFLYHSDAVYSAGDAVIDLIDWCVRNVSHKKMNSDHDPSLKVSGINIIRCLSENRLRAPITLSTRLFETHDVLLTLVPLLESGFWIKKIPTDKWWENNKWIPAEHDRLPKVQAQILLTIYSLVMADNTYDLSSSVRRENLLRVRRYLNEQVFDEIPPLVDLLRALENLAISGPQTRPSGAAVFNVELVAEFRQALLQIKQIDIDNVIAFAKLHVFRKESQDELVSYANIMARVYEEAMLDYKPPNCPVCEQQADQRCSGCKKVYYCSRECQIKHWGDHKVNCNIK